VAVNCVLTVNNARRFTVYNTATFNTAYTPEFRASLRLPRDISLTPQNRLKSALCYIPRTRVGCGSPFCDPIRPDL